MPDFQGSKKIKVQPGTYKSPYRFDFEACSAPGANDGSLPYGTLISSAAIKAFKHDVAGTEDAELVASSSNTDLTVTVLVSYPATNGVGRYKFEFILTLDDGSREEFDFGRVIVEDT